MEIERMSVANGSRPTVDAMAEPTRIASLRALADPVRLALVDELVRADVCACALRKQFDLSAPLLSHHLKVLREAGLISCAKVGRRVEVTLDRDALERLAESLAA